MGKTELIKAIVEKTGATKAITEATINAYIEVIEEAMAKGEKVAQVGFLTFEVTETKKDRVCGNPKDPSAPKTVIPAGTKKVKVKIGSKLKEAVK